MAETDPEMKAFTDEGDALAEALEAVLREAPHHSMIAIKIALGTLVAKYCKIGEDHDIGSAGFILSDFSEYTRRLLPRIITVPEQKQ